MDIDNISGLDFILPKLYERLLAATYRTKPALSPELCRRVEGIVLLLALAYIVGV